VHPLVADSAKSHQGCFSRVQKANGIANTCQKTSTTTHVMQLQHAMVNSQHRSLISLSRCK